MTNQTIATRDEDLILYIVSKLKNCGSFGSIMLNKVLYYSDNLNYIKYGRAISSFKYVHRDFGPTPKADTFLPLREKLIRDGKVKEEVSEGIVHNKKKLVALKPYNNSLFTKEEIEILDSVIADFTPLTAAEVSDSSHNELGWKLTKVGEEIPFHAFTLKIPEIKEEDYIWAEDETKRLNIICA